MRQSKFLSDQGVVQLSQKVKQAISGSRLKTYVNFIKVEHSIFSLPLIFAGMLLHEGGWPGRRELWLIILAAVGARIAAMGLNRFIDIDIDRRNPRTQQRALPRGAMEPWEGIFIVAIGCLFYMGSAAELAPICLWLSPIPLALFVIYPYLKRFTSFSHLGLGLTWSMAPLGGWLASAQSLDAISEVGLLWLFSILWVTGFDIIYATMDEAFDRKEKLCSLPARLGSRKALHVAKVLHLIAFHALVILWATQLRNLTAFVLLTCVGALFIWQHKVAGSRPEFAFFKINSFIGFGVFLFVLAGVH